MSSINEIANNFNGLSSDSNYLINTTAENEDFDMNQLSALFGPNFRPIEMNQTSFTSSSNLPGFYEDSGFNSNNSSFNTTSNSSSNETSPLHNLSGGYYSTNIYNPNNVANVTFQNSQNFIPNFAYTVDDYPFVPKRLRFAEYYFRHRNGPLEESCPTLLNALGYTTNLAANQNFQQQANTNGNTNYGFSSCTPFQFKTENFKNYSHQDGTISSSAATGVRMEAQHASNYVDDPNKPVIGRKLRKNSRTPFTQEQIQRLELEFERNAFSSNYEGVAGEINITPKQVQVWFQNKRSKLKRLFSRKKFKLARKTNNFV